MGVSRIKAVKSYKRRQLKKTLDLILKPASIPKTILTWDPPKRRRKKKRNPFK